MRFSFGAAFLVAGVAGGYITGMQALSRAGTMPAPDGSKWVQEVVNQKDPYNIYAIGHFKSEGQVPPPRSAQLFSRIVDEDGKALRGDCSYQLSSAAFPARWWAVNVIALGSSLPAVSSTAADVVITGDERLDINLSRHVATGNWLATPDASALKVTLTLHEPYDKNKKGVLNLPTLSKVSCE